MSTRLAAVSQSRISPPPIPQNFLIRNQVVSKLSNPDLRTIFICAPAGYGKTTVAAQWAVSNPDSTIWYTAAQEDALLDIYFHVVEGARKIIPEFAPWLEQIRVKEPNIRELIIALANEFIEHHRNFTIIFDNVDDLPKGSGQLSRLWAQFQPANVRSVAIRRNLPTQDLVNLLVPSAKNYISAADLRFTAEEELQIMEAFGLSAEDIESRDILSKAQGWPSAFSLLCNRLSGTKDQQIAARNFLANLDGANLLNKALTSLNGDDRTFLKKLSLLEVITPELAYAITGDSQAKIRLARLSFEGLYLNCLNLEQEEYELNGLVREKFESELLGEVEDRNGILEKLAHFHEKNGNAIQAIEIYKDLGMEEAAKPLLQRIYPQLMYQGDYRRIERWVTDLAQFIPIRNLGKEVVLAMAGLIKADPRDTRLSLNRLEKSGEAVNSQSKIEIYSDILKSRIDFSAGRLDQVLQIFSKYVDSDLSTLRDDSQLIASIARSAAAAAFLLENFESISFINSYRPKLEPQSRPERITAKPHSIHGLYLLAIGEFREAREYALAELKSSQQLGARGIYFPYESSYILAETQRELGELDFALSIAQEAVAEARAFQLWPWVAGFESKIAYCEFQRGNRSRAFEILREVREELLAKQVHSDAFRIIDEHELIIRSQVSDSARSLELLARLPMTPTVKFLKSVTGKTKTLKSTELEGEANIREKIYHLIITAENADGRSSAMENAMEALRLGFEHGYQETFLSRSDQFSQLILDLAGTHSLTYLENLARLVRERLHSVETDAGKLTARELDILRNLATGKPLIQISKALHISQNTMKTHLRNVYRKLGADSRETATKIARDRLLL